MHVDPNDIINKLRIFDEFGGLVTLVSPSFVIEITINCRSCSTKYVTIYDKKKIAFNATIISSSEDNRLFHFPIGNVTELGQYQIETGSGRVDLVDLTYRLCK